MSEKIVLDLLCHNNNCGEEGKLCYVKHNPKAPERRVLRFPHCLINKAKHMCIERARKIQEEDMFTPLEEFRSEPLCDTSEVMEKVHTSCCNVPMMEGEVRIHTDECKKCHIHEIIRQCATSVMVICAIPPENVDGIDNAVTFTPVVADSYQQRFNSQINSNQKEYVNWLLGKSDIDGIHIGVACEIFAWEGIRPSDCIYNKLFTRGYAWVSRNDYFGGKDDGYKKSLREAHDKITTMGRPTSMVYNSLACTLKRATCKDTDKFRCHIDDKLLARSHQKATYSIVDNLWPELPSETLNYCAITMALFTDAIDVIHDFHKCRSSNGLLPFVIRGYCIRSVLLASYRRTLSILPDDYKPRFRNSIKRVMYACVTNGTHHALEQTIGCECDDNNRHCRKWIPNNSKYCTDADGEDYMNLFRPNLIEPTFEDRDRLVSKIYTYLLGKIELEDFLYDPDLEAKVAWTFSRLQHTCMIHKCPHNDYKDKRR